MSASAINFENRHWRRVYGARKLWKAAKRAGHDIGRDQVARHMRASGITGARRGKRVPDHQT